MRSIRRAAIAGATAAALLVGAASAATAEDSTPAGDTQTQGTAQNSEKKDASSDKTKSGSSDKKDGEKKDGKSSSAGSSSDDIKAVEVDAVTFAKTKSALHMVATGNKPSMAEIQTVWSEEYSEVMADLQDESEFKNASDEEKMKMVNKALTPKIVRYLATIKGDPGFFREGKIKTANPDKEDGYEYLLIPSRSDAFSAAAGIELEAAKTTNGRAVFGSDRSDFDSLPKWAKALKIITIIGGIASTLGLVIFPAYNFLLANGYIR